MACLWTHLEPYGWELHFRMGTSESRDRLSTTMSSQPEKKTSNSQLDIQFKFMSTNVKTCTYIVGRNLIPNKSLKKEGTLI